MKPFRFHPEARAEANAAFEYYWIKSPQAALNFDDELVEAYRALQRTPHLYANYLHDTRRVLLHRFPFFVVFRELPDVFQIIAVAHGKRRPGYWKKRLKH